ncbi:MAG: DNA replication and repair protein RecF [Polyangiaceae bacterium]|nr:DNA replication and repair protein RecF [Polyangiaceae bacterium]
MFEQVEVRNLRNLEHVELLFDYTTNVVCGDNGQGKTSLLEAVYLAATSRSFRTHRLREIVRHGSEAAIVRARVHDSLGPREHLVAISPNQRVVKVDDQRPESIAAFAVRTPVVVFHPGELTLTMGPAAMRRTLLDRVALFVDPSGHAAGQAHKQAMRARQRLLQTSTGTSRALEAYEHVMAEQGALWTRRRREAADLLLRAARAAFERMAPAGTSLAIRYEPSGGEDASAIRRRLATAREADRRRASACVGPHRDELVFELDGRLARTEASQGQHRLLTLSLKIAEMDCIRAVRGMNPLLLLDDVSSELDASRNEAFFELLGTRRDQVFLTTTRPEMLPVFEQKLGGAKVFELRAGQVVWTRG